MHPINPTQAYYIKLGAGGEREPEFITSDYPSIWVGFDIVPHDLCTAGRWNDVGKLLQRAHNWPASMVTTKVNQLRAFYEAGEGVLWITFYQGRLWWCFAGANITVLEDNSHTRPALGGWKSTDLQGQPLDIGRLSGSLLSMQGYRGTLCKVHELDYLVRKINGEESPAIFAAQQAYAELQKSLGALVRSLHWKDFELLVDLIFRQAGWQRISDLGKTQKTLDVDLYSPATNERFLVQVKSKADTKIAREFVDQTSEMEDYARCYLVVHTPAASLTRDWETDTHKLWLPSDIARLVIQYGLADWLISKAK